jgi:RNA recognition motif-containing protein
LDARFFDAIRPTKKTKQERKMNNRLYVGNLSYDTTTEGLRACFAEVGQVTDTHVVTDRETGRARGFAFVTMATEAEATHAIAQLNGAMFEGRPLRVNVAEERSSARGGSSGGARGGHRGW